MKLKSILEELGDLTNREERKLKRRLLLQKLVDPKEHKKNVKKVELIKRSHMSPIDIFKIFYL